MDRPTYLKFSALALGARLLALTSASLLGPAGAALLGQNIPSDEVRLSTHPYRPGLLRVESVEIEVGVVVLDEKGRVVTGLKPEDFSVYDDGKKQQLSGFSVVNRTPLASVHPSSQPSAAPTVESNSPSQPPAPAVQPRPQPPRPRYVALFFDDFHTKSGDVRHVQLAAQEFIGKGLSSDERVGVFAVSGSPNLVFTSDASALLDALSKLKSHERVFGNSSCPRMTAHDAYLIVNNLDPDPYKTALTAAIQCNCEGSGNIEIECSRQQERVVHAIAWDVWAPTLETSQETLASLRSVLSDLGKMPGDRVLLVASSGFYAGELQKLVDDLVNDALRSGIVINALDAKGLYTEDPSHGRMVDETRADRSSGMMRLRHEAESFGPSLFFSEAPMTAFAIGTGGQFFHNRNDLTAGYYSLAVAPETEYLLGFAPDKAKLNGGFHKLKVEVSMPGKVEVQARPAYFAPTKESSGPSAEEKIDGEVRGSEERSDFPLSVSERDQTASNGDRKLSVEMRVDIRKLPFERRGERRIDMLTFVAALFDAQGKMVNGEEAQAQLALKPDTFEGFSKSGLSVVTSLKAPPGAYSLRVVVEEALQGKLSATSKNVQIQSPQPQQTGKEP